MVQSVSLKVKHLLAVSTECVQKTVSALDSDMNKIKEWMSQCIKEKKIANTDITFSVSNQRMVDMDPLFISTESFDEIQKEYVPVMSNRIQKSGQEIEDSLFRKYNSMTFEDLKRECSRYGITITNPRTECIKKLISCELSKKDIKKSSSVPGSPRLRPPASPKTTSHQRPPPLSHLSPLTPSTIAQRQPPSLLSPRLLPGSYQRSQIPSSPKLLNTAQTPPTSPSGMKPRPKVTPPKTPPPSTVPPPSSQQVPVATPDTKKIQTVESQFNVPQPPEWTQKKLIKEELEKQQRFADRYNITPDKIFSFPDTVNLKDILGIYLRRNVSMRGSSGNWTEIVQHNQLMCEVELSDDGITACDQDSEDSSDSWYSMLSE